MNLGNKKQVNFVLEMANLPTPATRYNIRASNSIHDPGAILFRFSKVCAACHEDRGEDGPSRAQNEKRTVKDKKIWHGFERVGELRAVVCWMNLVKGKICF